MPSPPYWVELSADRGPCGAGFLYTRRYVLTAAHCLRNKVGEDELVTVTRSGGDTARGRVVAIHAGRDVAVIQILGPLTWTDLSVAADWGRPGDSWFAPYRPRSDDSELRGRVLTRLAEFECGGGDLIEALELEVRQQLGYYAGYSGGPVERAGGDEHPNEERPVVGMLIEQRPHRVRPEEATNVLFAITIQCAVETFDLFHRPRMVDGPGPAGHAVATSQFTRLRTTIDELKALVTDGYISVADATEAIRDALRIAVRRSIEAGER